MHRAGDGSLSFNLSVHMCVCVFARGESKVRVRYQHIENMYKMYVRDCTNYICSKVIDLQPILDVAHLLKMVTLHNYESNLYTEALYI